MKFFFDENMPLSSAEALSDLGHEVEHVRTAGMCGADDEEIAEYAKEEKAVLVTKDKEFGNILLYPKGSHYGLVIVRLPYSYAAEKITGHLEQFVRGIDLEELVGYITVLELGRYRRREI
ncbi:MAG: DUF5615 family PIN-like protein [Candidatus Aenigmatarchaeota archaeon]